MENRIKELENKIKNLENKIDNLGIKDLENKIDNLCYDIDEIHIYNDLTNHEISELDRFIHFTLLNAMVDSNDFTKFREYLNEYYVDYQEKEEEKDIQEEIKIKKKKQNKIKEQNRVKKINGGKTRKNRK
jgi:DNA phosphorothioation-dependent restriction protein DptG